MLFLQTLPNISDRAVAPGGFRMNSGILNKIMKVATDKKITALADACLFHEKQKPAVQLEEITKEEYKLQVEAQQMNLLY